MDDSGFGRRLSIANYLDGSNSGMEPRPWYYENSYPEIVRTDSTITCGFGGCVDAVLELRRDVGITEWYWQTTQRTLFRTSLLLQ